MTGAEIGEGNEDAKKHKERLGECGRVGKGRDKGREGRDEGSGHGEAAARDVRAVETCAEAAWAFAGTQILVEFRNDVRQISTTFG